MLRVNIIRRVLLTCGTSIALKTKLGWRLSLGTSLTFSFYVSNLLNATVQSFIFFPKPASYVLPLKPFARLVLAGKQGAMWVNDLCSKRFFSRQPCFFCSSKIVEVLIRSRAGETWRATHWTQCQPTVCQSRGRGRGAGGTPVLRISSRDVVFGVNRLTVAIPSRVRFLVVSCQVR